MKLYTYIVEPLSIANVLRFLRFANQVSDDFCRCDTIVGWVCGFHPSWDITFYPIMGQFSRFHFDQGPTKMRTFDRKHELVHLFDPWDDWSPIYIHLHIRPARTPGWAHCNPWQEMCQCARMTEAQFKAIAQKLLSEQAQTTLWRDMVLVGWLEMHSSAPFFHHPTIINPCIFHFYSYRSSVTSPFFSQWSMVIPGS